jgi:hypothetical protein
MITLREESCQSHIQNFDGDSGRAAMYARRPVAAHYASAKRKDDTGRGLAKMAASLRSFY